MNVGHTYVHAHSAARLCLLLLHSAEVIIIICIYIYNLFFSSCVQAMGIFGHMSAALH